MEGINCHIWQVQAGKQMSSIRGHKFHDDFNKIKHLVSSRMLSAVYREMELCVSENMSLQV